MTTIAGSSTSATGLNDGIGSIALFDYPSGVLLSDDDLYVFVADRSNNKIRRVEISSRSVNTLQGSAESSILYGLTGLAWLPNKSGLLVSAINTMSIHLVFGVCDEPSVEPTLAPSSSNPTIYTSPDGLFCEEVMTVVVAGAGTTGSADGTGTRSKFHGPNGMASSPDGSYILIAGNSNHNIRKFMPA